MLLAWYNSYRFCYSKLENSCWGHLNLYNAYRYLNLFSLIHSDFLGIYLLYLHSVLNPCVWVLVSRSRQLTLFSSSISFRRPNILIAFHPQDHLLFSSLFLVLSIYLSLIPDDSEMSNVMKKAYYFSLFCLSISISLKLIIFSIWSYLFRLSILSLVLEDIIVGSYLAISLCIFLWHFCWVCSSYF